MRPTIELKSGGFIFTLALPWDAQAPEFTRAVPGQNVPALVTGPLKVTGTGAGAAPVPPFTGAPAVPGTSRGGPARTRTPQEKIEYYRDEIKALTAEKIGLTASFDAREAIRKNVIAELAGVDPVIESGKCLAAHDRLLAAHIEHGRSYLRYREVDGMIKTLTVEVERLSMKVAA